MHDFLRCPMHPTWKTGGYLLFLGVIQGCCSWPTPVTRSRLGRWRESNWPAFPAAAETQWVRLRSAVNQGISSADSSIIDAHYLFDSAYPRSKIPKVPSKARLEDALREGSGWILTSIRSFLLVTVLTQDLVENLRKSVLPCSSCN